MIKDSFPTLLVGTRERIVSLQKRDEEIDALTDAIVLYLRRLATADLIDPQPVYLQQFLGIADYLEKIADVIETGIAADGFKRLDQELAITEATEDILRDIYKERYLAAQTTFEAMAANDPDKANAVNASKKRINGLVECARNHLYKQLRGEKHDQLQDYKLESNTLENFKRIYNMLRSICKLIMERTTYSTEASRPDAASTADGKSN